MKVPKYVQEIMERSSYDFDFDLSREDCGAGYTIKVRKSTPYTKASTFTAEIERLHKWANKICPGCCHIISTPTKTHYCNQIAVVTIFDPVMKDLEKIHTQGGSKMKLKEFLNIKLIGKPENLTVINGYSVSYCGPTKTFLNPADSDMQKFRDYLLDMEVNGYDWFKENSLYIFQDEILDEDWPIIFKED